MEQMKCDIIQDLIPSYVDQICSEATRKCVEEHIRSCRECQQMVELGRNHALSREKMEQKELDGLKKIKQIGQLKGLVCCGLMLFLVVCLGLNLFVFKENVLSDSGYTVMLIVCMILVLISGAGYTGRAVYRGKGMGAGAKEESGSREHLQERKISRIAVWVIGVVSCSVCAYIFMLDVGIVKMMQAGKESFLGKKLEEIGPVVEGQVIIGFAICMIFLAYVIFRIFKYGKEGNWLICLLVADTFLLFQYVLLLVRIDTIETITWALLAMTARTMFIGGVGIVCSLLISHYLKRKAKGI